MLRNRIGTPARIRLKPGEEIQMQQGDGDEFRRELAVAEFEDAARVRGGELIEESAHGPCE